MRLMLVLLAGTPALRLHAQATLPPVVQQGLTTLRLGKCQKAFELWTGSWPEMQKAQMAPSCSALQQIGGEYTGYEVLKSIDISPHLNRVYLVLLYRKQPVYVMFVLYRVDDKDWSINTLNWNTDPDKVVPASVLPPQRPGPPDA